MITLLPKFERSCWVCSCVAIMSLAPLGRIAAAQEVVDTFSCRAAPGSEGNVKIFTSWINEVWHQGQIGLVSALIGPEYVRHEGSATRTTTPSQYAQEITATRRRLPDVRFIVHDCAAVGDRLWTRWTMIGRSAESGQLVRRMANQVYRVSNERLVETWMLMLPNNAAWPEQRDTSTLRLK